MKITRTAGPVMPKLDTGALSSTQQQARQNAINILQGKSTSEGISADPQIQRLSEVAKPTKVALNLTQNQKLPVLDANSISPEEIGAIKAKESNTEDSEEQTTEANTQSSESGVETQGQSDNTEEATQVQATEKKSEDIQLSAQYAQLARREKAMRAQHAKNMADIQKLKAEVEAERNALKSKDSEYQEQYISKQRLKEDAINALAEAGISYEDITKLVLQQPQSPEYVELNNNFKTVLKRLEEIEGRQTKTDTSIQEREKAAYNQALKQIRMDTESLVNQDEAGDFELIKETGSFQEVVDLIETTYKQDGVLLTVQEAAKEVEDYLTEESLKIAKSKKLQKLLGKSVTSGKQEVTQSAVKKAIESNKLEQTESVKKTLTNNMGSTKPISARERAIAAFNAKNTG